MRPLLEIEKVTLSYNGKPVLEHVSLEVFPGQVMALIGPNGAGKTSLIRAASGVAVFQSGSIHLDGRELTGLKPAERARLVAVVPQARQLPGAFTAQELVSTGRTPWLDWLGKASERDESIVCDAMRRTDTLGLAGRRVGELSGGEQQRLLLARALAQAAPLMLLDEPSAHLDLRYQVELLDRMRALAEEMELGVLVALHDLNLVARIADQATLLVQGKVMASGTIDEVFTPEILNEAYGIPLERLLGKGRHRAIILPREERYN